LALEKIRETPPQVSLGREGRLKNIQGSIACVDKALIKNRKILLIDDISTTGATLSECARSLKESGAKEVFGIIIARA
jgi:competence protein ComFC